MLAYLPPPRSQPSTFTTLPLFLFETRDLLRKLCVAGGCDTLDEKSFEDLPNLVWLPLGSESEPRIVIINRGLYFLFGIWASFTRHKTAEF